MRRMHVHGICSMHVPMRTSLGWPRHPVERPAPVATAAAARPATRAVEALPLAVVAARMGSPVRVGVGGEDASSCLHKRAVVPLPQPIRLW